MSVEANAAAATQAAVTTTAAPPVVTPEPPKLSPLERAKAAYSRVQEAAVQRAALEAKPKDPPAAKVGETPPDPKSPPAPEPTKEDEKPLSVGWAKVAKLEREAREARKAAKADSEVARKQVAEMQAKIDALEKAKAEARLNPTAWLEQGGISIQEANEYLVNNKTPTAEGMAAHAIKELEALKKQQAEAKAKEAEAAQEATKAEQAKTYQTWQNGVVDFVKKNEADYELINQQGAHQLVPAVIQQKYNETAKTGTPVILSEKEAADLVEKHLEQQAEKLFATKKLSTKFQPAVVAPQPKTEAQPRTTTLTNGLTTSAQTNGSKPKTWAEKKANALLAMENARK